MPAVQLYIDLESINSLLSVRIKNRYSLRAYIYSYIIAYTPNNTLVTYIKESCGGKWYYRYSSCYPASYIAPLYNKNTQNSECAGHKWVQFV
jgi:hypothetical protein